MEHPTAQFECTKRKHSWKYLKIVALWGDGRVALYTEDDGCMILQNVGNLLQDYTGSDSYFDSLKNLISPTRKQPKMRHAPRLEDTTNV
jgi:hypothetical protein